VETGETRTRGLTKEGYMREGRGGNGDKIGRKGKCARRRGREEGGR